MRVNRVVFDLVDEIGKPVTLRIEVRGVDLVDIASENDLGIFTGPGDNGFHFVWGQVLGFIYDETNIGYTGFPSWIVPSLFIT